MKNTILLTFSTVLSLGFSAQAATDWSQPPVACVEEIVPQRAERPCPDLTSVGNVYSADEFPGDLSSKELAYWQTNKKQMRYCRAKEVLRRAKEEPGSVTPVQIEVSWMQASAGDNRDQKIAAVYEASRVNKIPAQVLAGALYQESIFAELGVAEDGGNYSCGVGQINIQEWCRWAVARPASVRTKLGWPSSIACEDLSPGLVQPFHSIAKANLDGRAEYRMTKADFAKIPFEKVVTSFPKADAGLQKLRYAAVNSFLQNCSNPAYGIAAKANELARLYRNHVPSGLKLRDQYPEGKKFNRECREEGYTKSYPLATGWLLAVGAYNSGPRVTDAMAYYNNWTLEQTQDPETFRGFNPKKLVESIYHAGRYSAKDDKTYFRNLQGGESSLLWFKQCVLQRHIARVVQHATLPNVAPLADTLEGDSKCAKAVFDGKTKKLISTSAPAIRQQAPGRMDMDEIRR